MLSHFLLDTFRLTVQEKDLGVYGVHVYQEGNGSVEHRFRSDDKVHVYSASKTFTSVAVGICQDEGRLKLTDKALDFFPQCKAVATPGTEDITLRDLLHMMGGKNQKGYFTDVEPKVADETDWAELFFRSPQVWKAGERFFYDSTNTYMLSRVVEAASGQTLREYLKERVFDSFGFHNIQWLTCPGGHSLGGSGLLVTTSELAHIGRLMLQDGVWNDKQIVSAAYINAMHTDMVDPQMHFPDEEQNAGYGYQVWGNTTPGTWRADGLYGQYSIVIPEKRAVVTTTCHNEHVACDIVRAVFNDIVPRL